MFSGHMYYAKGNDCIIVKVQMYRYLSMVRSPKSYYAFIDAIIILYVYLVPLLHRSTCGSVGLSRAFQCMPCLHCTSGWG
jgi:hypothetical protein